MKPQPSETGRGFGSNFRIVQQGQEDVFGATSQGTSAKPSRGIPVSMTQTVCEIRLRCSGSVCQCHRVAIRQHVIQPQAGVVWKTFRGAFEKCGRRTENTTFFNE